MNPSGGLCRKHLPARRGTCDRLRPHAQSAPLRAFSAVGRGRLSCSPCRQRPRFCRCRPAVDHAPPSRFSCPSHTSCSALLPAHPGLDHPQNRLGAQGLVLGQLAERNPSAVRLHPLGQRHRDQVRRGSPPRQDRRPWHRIMRLGSHPLGCGRRRRLRLGQTW